MRTGNGSVRMALVKLAAPRDGRPLLAAEPCGRLIAVSSCGLVVHALRGTERVASWRLPSRALRHGRLLSILFSIPLPTLEHIRMRCYAVKIIYITA